MDAIRIGQLETAINRARASAPAQGVESALSPDVAVLAGIYGRLIYLHRDRLDPADLDPAETEVLQRWLAAP